MGLCRLMGALESLAMRPLGLSPASLLALGLRHVEIGFDLYGPDDDSPA